MVLGFFCEKQTEEYLWCVRDALSGVHSTSQYKLVNTLTIHVSCYLDPDTVSNGAASAAMVCV